MVTDELLNNRNIAGQTSTFCDRHLVLALAEVECLSRDTKLDLIRDVS